MHTFKVHSLRIVHLGITVSILGWLIAWGLYRQSAPLVVQSSGSRLVDVGYTLLAYAVALLLGPLTAIRCGRGCAACWNTGYRGRTGVYELLVMDENVRLAIAQQRTAAELRALAQAGGMRTPRDDGHRVVGAGLTTPEEVLRASGV
jgi:general secretion pathway protein E